MHVCLYLWDPQEWHKCLKTKYGLYHWTCAKICEQNMDFLKLDIYIVASNTSVEIIDLLDLQKIFVTRDREPIIPRQPNCGSHEPWEVIFSHQIWFWEVIYKIFHKYLSGFVTQHSLAKILGVCLAEWSQYCNKNVKIVLSIDSLANEEQPRAFYEFAGWPYVLQRVHADEPVKWWSESKKSLS